MKRGSRRDFLRQAGLTTAGALLARPGVAAGAGLVRTVTLVRDPADDVASSRPAVWAAGELQRALAAHGIGWRSVSRLGDAPASDACLVAAGKAAPVGRGTPLPDQAEAFALAAQRIDGREVVVARAGDARGMVYALTELADRAGLADEPLGALVPREAVSERPANAIRSCMRMFCSDVEDKAWFHDRAFWTAYLSMLVGQRFNRFNLSFGLGYDFTTEITDAYLHFAYPFLLRVPGYDVRATNVSDAERDRNLETLRFISDAAAERGLQFQLGLWTHAYEWTRSPNANHRIEGLTAETHAPYCRDALALLLNECPGVAGVTIRTHGESGVAEGSYPLWSTIFEGVRRSGRRVEIDLHAKGLDQKMIEAALATGMPVVVSPKFWAEHMGLPYHQAWIRPTELPQRQQGEGLFALSSGSRSFLRYGYGDLFAEGRGHGIVHRIWPGTQRLLLSGDPAHIAAYGRAAGFCGGQGVELMEPLSFKGRKGSGQRGPRTGYKDAALAPAHDFEKYLYTYRLWGRLLYDPDARPASWRRLLDRHYGASARGVEATLAASSRILPLVTTAHTPSAANNHWWPEMPVHMSIVDASSPEPFTDTPTPKRFGAVSPLDPQLFSRPDDFASELLGGAIGERYSPAEVAASLDALADAADRERGALRASSDAAYRRFAIDAAVNADLGRFFAAKLRAAVLFALFERNADQWLLAEAIGSYTAARQAWQRIVDSTTGVYMDDVSYGVAWYQRGHWADRTAALDKDIAAMRQLQTGLPGSPTDASRRLLDVVLRPPARTLRQMEHDVPKSFHRGQDFPVEVQVRHDASAVRLFYRHVNQAEPWRVEAMVGEGSLYRAAIPAGYTDSPFPLQYYFAVSAGPSAVATLHPGFDATWSRQPYFVVR
jgi:hypothetical protein